MCQGRRLGAVGEVVAVLCPEAAAWVPARGEDGARERDAAIVADAGVHVRSAARTAWTGRTGMARTSVTPQDSHGREDGAGVGELGATLATADEGVALRTSCFGATRTVMMPRLQTGAPGSSVAAEDAE